MSKKRKRSPWPVALLFRLLVFSAAASLVISYVSIFINPAVTSLPLFFGLYFIPLVIINLIILIAGILRKSGVAWTTFVVLLPAIIFAELFVRWGEVKEGENGIALKVCTYNVGLFSQGSNKSRDFNIKGIEQFIAKENPAIVCLQEFHVRDTASIAKMFPSYPYRHYHLFNGRKGSKFGNVTLSRFPITHRGEITFKGSTNLCLYTHIEHYGKTIRVYNAHLESHSISFTTLIKKMRESNQVTEDIYEVHDKMAGTFRRRAMQVDSVVKHTQNTEAISIVCGDFNDTPMSYTYNSLIKNRKDSFRQSGKGFSATYSLLWPLLRIDYILYPHPVWSISHTTPKIEFSDHYPVISELIIP